jgi:hypothetical protein
MPQDQTVIDRAIQLVQDDIVDGFKGVLNEIDDDEFFVIELGDSHLGVAELVAPSDAAVVPVPWRFRCKHEARFLGVPATFVTLDLRGTTFVFPTGDDDSQWLLYRYVDYLGALHQMGVSTGPRAALTPDQYEVWRNRGRTPSVS